MDKAFTSSARIAGRAVLGRMTASDNIARKNNRNLEIETFINQMSYRAVNTFRWIDKNVREVSDISKDLGYKLSLSPDVQDRVSLIRYDYTSNQFSAYLKHWSLDRFYNPERSCQWEASIKATDFIGNTAMIELCVVIERPYETSIREGRAAFIEIWTTADSCYVPKEPTEFKMGLINSIKRFDALGQLKPKPTSRFRR